MRRGLGTSRTSWNVPTANYRGARRRRGRTKHWKLIWTNNEGELPNLAKEIDFQEVQEAQRVPKKLDRRRNTPRHIIIMLPKIKEKERILKAEREKESITYKGVPIDCQLTSQKRPYRQEGASKKYSKSWKARTYIQDYCIQQSYPFRMEGQIKCFSDKVKFKEFIITKPLLYEMLKAFI